MACSATVVNNWTFSHNAEEPVVISGSLQDEVRLPSAHHKHIEASMQRPELQAQLLTAQRRTGRRELY